jgi:hypothetical protein
LRSGVAHAGAIAGISAMDLSDYLGWKRKRPRGPGHPRAHCSGANSSVAAPLCQ